MIFSSHTHVKRTRKVFRCIWCAESIDAGQPCDVLSGKNEWGDMGSDRYHPECYAALQTLSHDECDSWDYGDFLRGCKCEAGTECRCKRKEPQLQLPTQEQREKHACEVCGNVPDEDGFIEHGRGCYVVNEDGGGITLVEFGEELKQ